MTHPLLRALASLVTPGASKIIRIQGQSKFDLSQQSALYLGNEANFVYLRDLFFKDSAAEHLTSIRYPLFPIAQIDSQPPRVDLLLSDVPHLWHPLLGIRHDLIMPAWVRQEIHLNHDQPSGKRLIARPIEKEIERHTRRERYRIDVTSDPKDLARFFHELYSPYIRSRFGEQAIIVSESVFLDHSKTQRLVRLHSDNNWIAGMLLAERRNSIKFGWFGANSNPPRAGAAEVIDGFCIRYAHENGIARVIMGNSRPNLDDGIVRYKAKFGARILPTRFPQPALGIKVFNWTDGIRTCFSKQPLLTQKNGRCLRYQLTESGKPAVELKTI